MTAAGLMGFGRDAGAIVTALADLLLVGMACVVSVRSWAGTSIRRSAPAAPLPTNSSGDFCWKPFWLSMNMTRTAATPPTPIATLLVPESGARPPPTGGGVGTVG
jgi:hypothetical protein